MVNSGSHALDRHTALTLTTLGAWALTYPQAGQGVLPILGPSKPLALLAYLTCCPGRSANREHLVDLLWADLEPDAAQHAFRQTLWYIRQRLGTEAIHSAGGVVALGIPVDADRDRFLAAVAGQDYDCAAQLYRGEFLPGFAAPGGAEFERWADIERARLRGLFVRAAESLARQRLASGRLKDATALARRVRDADPDLEAAWRLLIETLIAAQNWLSAAVEADALERFLAEESREPEPATRVLLRAARQQPGAADASAPAQLVAELVGREAEFSAVLGAWEEVKAGKGRHVHVVAPAGLGKTRLLADVNARLRAGGALVAAVRANPGERGLAFALAAELAARLSTLPGAKAVSPATAATLVGLNPSLAHAYPETRQNGSTDPVLHRSIALADLVAAVADEAQLAILVDDLHWADDASRAVLSSVLERLDGQRVLFVTTTRPRPERAILRDGTRTIELAPLAPPQVRDLLTSIARLPDESWAAGLADGLYRATQGSPLLVLETLQLGLQLELLRRDADAWVCPDAAALGHMLAEGSALARRIAELTREQAWLLTLLAAAGAPVPAAALECAVPRPDDSLRADLLTLEQRALAVRAGDGWTTAHDEIAARTLAAATPEATRVAHLALGRGWQAVPERWDALRLAAQHLVAADELESVGPLLAIAVRHAALRGDGRPPTALARELLGEHGTAARVQQLCRLLPLRYRAGLTTPARTAAAAAVATAVLGAAAWGALRPAPTPPDATLIFRIASESGAPEYRSVPLRQADWQGGRTEEIEQVGSALSPPTGMAGAESLGTLASFSDAGPGLGWLATLDYPDSGGQEIALADTAGRLVRLTFAPGDDIHGTLSPDRRFMVFSTSTWNPRMLYDIAVMDLRSHSVRQLTGGNDADHSPQWSPDGTRIAFERIRHQDLAGSRPSDLCVMTVSGRILGCSRPDSGLQFSVVAWRDSTSLLVNRQGPADSDFGILDLRTGRFTPLLIDGETRNVSPDGAWAIRAATNRATGVTESFLFPVDRPGDAIRLTRRLSTTLVTVGWALEPRHDYVDALVVETPDTLRIRIPFRLHVAARLHNGQITSPEVLDFASDDPSIVEVDSSGTLIARRSGQTTIRVSAGGWRDTTVKVRAAAPGPSPILFEERWESDSAAGWHLYGYPRPQLVHDRSHRVFWNAGDGNYESGAFTLGDFDARSGLGAEAWVSAPLDSGQWQSVMMRFSAMIDTAQVRRWNDRSGWLPANALHGASRECRFGFPPSYSQSSADSALLQIGDAWHRVVRTPGLSRGRWFRARVQIFPDGRCGLAIDGRPIAISDARLDLSRRYRANIYGNSAWTRILVGPLQVWGGVRTDVDWASLDRPTRHP